MPRGLVQPGDVLGGKYHVVRPIGAGQMGEVWVALNTLTDRQVALKLVRAALATNEEVRARVLREARACGRIEHRNVVEIYDVGQTADGDPFLVMPLLSGETLAERIAREGALASNDAATVALAVARGLAAAHAAGVVHRDLKPANIFLHHERDATAPTVKILDFGVSKLSAHTDAAASITGVALGSPAYMSPEQARGARDIDGRSDMWSFGVLLFELLTGGRPFDGATAYAVADQVLRGEIPSVDARVPGAPRALTELVARCLVRDVGVRAHAAEAVAALQAVVEPARAVADAPTSGTYAAVPVAPGPYDSGGTLPLVRADLSLAAGTATTATGMSLAAPTKIRSWRLRLGLAVAVGAAASACALALATLGTDVDRRRAAAVSSTASGVATAAPALSQSAQLGAPSSSDALPRPSTSGATISTGDPPSTTTSSPPPATRPLRTLAPPPATAPPASSKPWAPPGVR